jgi:hypothetical protein
MYGRIERERVAREKIIDDLFDVLRHGGGLMAARTAMNAAQKVYGARIVKDALHDYNESNMGAIGGHMIQRGYLTMDHVTELLRSDRARKIDEQNTVCPFCGDIACRRFECEGVQ